MDIYITGIAGFIGTNLALNLEKKGYKVSGIDNLCSKTRNIEILEKNNIKVETNSISNLSSLPVNSSTIVIHLAALGNVVESVGSPKANFQSNVAETLHLLELLRKSSSRNIIFSSTGGALMGNSKPPVDENSLPSPISPYGASKLSCEGYLSAYNSSYGIRSLIFRFGNVYGPNSMHKKGVLNTFIKKSLNKKTIKFFGSEKTTRDYIHVDDICQGLIKGIEFMSKKEGDLLEIFHLANNKQVSLEEIRILIERILNRKINYEIKESRKGEVSFNSASFEKAKKVLNFSPKVALANGIKLLIEDIKANEKSNKI